MDINFELYKIFYHAACTRNFSEAAKKLYISQSAVSQAIKKLEDKTGEKLFYKSGRNINLTHEGELLFKHVEQAYNFIKTGEKKLLEMHNLNVGEVKIGVSDTICKYFLIPLFNRFHNLYPNIKIQVTNRTSPQIVAALKSGLVDFGIVTLPVNDKAIDSQFFLEVEDIFVACERYSELKNKKVSLEELASYPLLMLESKSSTRQNIDKIFKKHGMNLTPEIELESVELLVEFAKIGLGIAHVLKESALEAIDSRQLFQVNTSFMFPKRKLGIITAKDMPLSHASKELISVI